VLFSSFFKKWNFSSPYGTKAIKKLCEKIKAPAGSLENHEFMEREVEVNRFILTALVIFYSIFLFFQISVVFFLRKHFLTWNEFFILSAIAFLNHFLAVMLTDKEKGIYLCKYIIAFFAFLFWTLMVIFLSPGFNPFLITGYIYILMILTYFRNVRVIVLGGIFAVAGYLYVFFKLPLRGIFLQNDLATIVWLTALIGFVARNLQIDFIEFIKARGQVEEAKMTLEVKIAARTRELKEMADDLEVNIKERTTELREKINELEKFQKVTIGRELKMIEMKREIENLKNN
jgi:hypothetical protein